MRKLSRNDFVAALAAPIFKTIGEVADAMGVECYVVGGYVRDLFLERKSKDIDVVVVGSGIQVAEALGRRLGRKAHVSVFKNFGTAQVKYGDTEVEFVGARKESYSHDSRKPVVEDGTLEDDQLRRDFTINAMAVSLNKERYGELVDPFGGVMDLEDGIIATPGDPDVTFSDDPLRMMRCVRFATQLNFQIEDSTFEGLERNAERIRIISQERISDELNKIMASAVPSRGWVELSRCGLLPLIFPELAAMEGVERKNGIGHKDNFYHTLQVLDTVAGKAPVTGAPIVDDNNLWLRWAALLHDIGKPRTKRFDPVAGWTFKNHNYVGAKMVAEIFRRMKLPMDARMAYVERLVSLHMRPTAIADEGVTDSAVRRLLFESEGAIDDLMILAESDLTTQNKMKKASFLASFQNVRDKLADLQARDQIRLFQPCVDGGEIMERYGLAPSREVGVLKGALKDAIIDGTVENTREAALAFLDEKAKEIFRV
ncbi:MAG: HD domain-containing protein [Bacteroidaceae bacterium]|nr:HD domain-containing protein [Bacteroidaceae bacterium]